MRLVNRTFDELAIGHTAELRRLVTLDDLYVFAASSGNYNPMHLPNGDADGDGTPERIAPGMFVASLISAVLGTQLPGPGTLYRHQTLDFHDHVHAGEDLELGFELRPDEVRIRVGGELRQTCRLEGESLTLVAPWLWNPGPTAPALAVGSYQSPTRFLRLLWRDRTHG